MIRRLNVGGRLAMGFGALLAFLVGISAISIATLRSLHGELAAVTGEDAERLRLANTMRDLARYQAVTLRDVVMQDDIAFKKKELALMKRALDDYLKTAERLAARADEPELRAALGAAATAQAAIKSPTEKVLDRSLSDDMAGASAALREEVRPVQLAHAESIEKLTRAIEDSSLGRMKRSQQRYEQSLWLIATLGSAALLGGIAVGWLIQRSITRPLRDAVAVAEAVAAGDLSRSISGDARDEIGRLLVALRTATGSLSRMLHEVRGNAEGVATASQQIAQGGADLSQRTEEQAAALQRTASTMEQLGATARNNTDSAQQVSRVAQDTSGVAQRAGGVVEQVVETMRDINDSSRRIADIIGTVDAIAFQTNILALNAAVEASRAGEHGRGFAVVAGEVRTLAQRAAEAAREIKQLVGASVDRIRHGSALVEQARSTMDEVVAATKSVSQVLSEIASASNEQSLGVHQAGQAITQMDDLTQRNAALVEESAAAAESLKEQAQQLVGAVAVFRLRSAGVEG